MTGCSRRPTASGFVFEELGGFRVEGFGGLGFRSFWGFRAESSGFRVEGLRFRFFFCGPGLGGFGARRASLAKPSESSSKLPGNFLPNCPGTCSRGAHVQSQSLPIKLSVSQVLGCRVRVLGLGLGFRASAVASLS